MQFKQLAEDDMIAAMKARDKVRKDAISHTGVGCEEGGNR